MRIARSTVKLFAGRFGSSVIGFLGIAAFARHLTPGQIGAFFLFQTILGLLAVPADLGLQGALVKRLSECYRRDEDGPDVGRDGAPSDILSTALVLIAVPLGLIVVAILALRGVVNEYVGISIAVVLGAAVVVNELGKLAMNVLRGELRVGETGIVEFVHQAVWVGVGLALLQVGFGATAIVYSYVLGLSARLLLATYKRTTEVGRPNRRHARSLIEYAKFDLVGYVDHYLYNWLDVAILGLLVGQAAVGAYELAWRLTFVVVLLSSVIKSVLLPHVSSLDAVADRGEIERLIPDALTASLFLVVPSVLGTLVLAEEILRYLFGAEYTTATLVLTVLMAGKLVEAVDIVFKSVISGLDRPDLKAKAVAASIALNVVLNVVLVETFGMVGAAVATVASYAVSTLLVVYYVSTIITVRSPLADVGRCAVAANVMAGGLLLAKRAVPVTSLPRLLGFVAFGGLLYGLVAFGFPSIRTKILRNVRDVTGTDV